MTTTDPQLDRITELIKAIFGLKPGADPSHVISLRDAQDRADSIESSDDAVKLIQRAISSGDDVLAKAIVDAAMTSGWAAPVNMYTAANPSQKARIEELWALRREVASPTLVRSMRSRPHRMRSLSLTSANS
jgi:hypothetical protein